MDFANFSVENSWDSGFVGRIQFKNITDKPLNGWQFQFVAPFEVKEIWGADIVQRQGNLITVKPKTWNRQIAVVNPKRGLSLTLSISQEILV